MLVPSGTQADVLLFAFRGVIRAYLSEPVFSEYRDVLRRPRFKLDARQIYSARSRASFGLPAGFPSQPMNPDNRLLECAEAAKANYLVTGNTRHFPPVYKVTKIVTGRRFLEILADQQTIR